MRGQLLISLIIFTMIVLLSQRRNWPNIVFRFDMKYRWYSIDTLQITDEHKWSHTLYDLQRVACYASIPELTDTVIPSRPTHSYITPCKVGARCSSFVRVCCTLCLVALTYQESINVGIMMSKRTDNRSGNFLAMATCQLFTFMSPDMICNEIMAAISKPATILTNAFEFCNWYFKNNIVFNNWRSIETMDQRAPHLRLLSQGEPVVDFTTARQELKMSHDDTGWYIVHQTVWYR